MQGRYQRKEHLPGSVGKINLAHRNAHVAQDIFIVAASAQVKELQIHSGLEQCTGIVNGLLFASGEVQAGTYQGYTHAMQLGAHATQLTTTARRQGSIHMAAIAKSGEGCSSQKFRFVFGPRLRALNSSITSSRISSRLLFGLKPIKLEILVKSGTRRCISSKPGG